jgi:uracil-DNA glycosylase family 4
VYSGYKGARAKRREDQDEDELEEVFRQTDIAKKFIGSLGVRQTQVRGVEADDLISWFSSYLTEELQYQTIICTTDKDLWQLAGPQVSIYDVIKKELVDGTSAGPAFGVEPRQIPAFKSLVGDSSDSIQGVKGVGPKTARTLLAEYGDLSGLLDNQSELMKSKRTAAIFDNLEQMHLAWRLITLSGHREMRWCLNAVESTELTRELMQEVKRDPLGAQVAAERLGFMPPEQPDASVLGETVVGGMLGYVQPEAGERAATLASVDAQIWACTRCALRGCCSTYGPTLPQGYDDVEIMVIGRNPGYEDLLEGRPFVGPTGDRLDMFFEEVGLTRREVWLTNACKCYSEGNRPPSYGELMACSWYLKAEIELLKPKLILAFGNEAMSLVTPHGSNVMGHCGTIFENPYGLLLKMEIPARVAVCVHPSAALRSAKSETEMKYCAERVRELLECVK